MSIVLPRALFVPVLALIWAGQSTLPCQAQGLPNTNFGKFVHQPGDNQYEEKAQRERHSPSASVQRQMMQQQAAAAAAQAQGAVARPAWIPTPPPQLPDTSVQPIVADEPIKPAGFPPLPDRPDLPVTSAWARAGAGPPASGGGANPGGDNGGFSRRVQGVHEHYAHYMPGACIKQNSPPVEAPQGSSGSAPSNGYVAANNAPSNGNAGGTHGYYKCGYPSSGNPQSDVYASSSGRGRNAAPSGEPRLDPRRDGAAQPDAPTPVVVSQPATQEISSQDLSLPDDDYNAQNPSTTNGRGKRTGRAIQRNVQRTLYRVGAQALYTGVGGLHH